MIAVLNGYPGTGKLTVGRALAERIGGRLLDIHSVCNIAFALNRNPHARLPRRGRTGRGGGP